MTIYAHRYGHAGVVRVTTVKTDADGRFVVPVVPTVQTSAGGSSDSSRYIWYDDVPLGAVSCHGSSRVPLPCATFAPPFSRDWPQCRQPESGGCPLCPGFLHSASDLLGVIVAVRRIDLQPRLHRVRPAVAVRSGSTPVGLSQMLEDGRRRLATGAHCGQ